MDSLASQGTQFNRAYCEMAMYTPSRGKCAEWLESRLNRIRGSLCTFQMKDGGSRLAINHLSDEGLDGNKNGFTGAFVGILMEDRLYESKANIDYFNYTTR